MPGRGPDDHWDDEEEVARRYQEDDAYARDAGAQRGEPRHSHRHGRVSAPRFGGTGMTNYSSTGSWGSSGRYFDDEAGRAEYGGWGGSEPSYGGEPSHRPERLQGARPDPGRRAAYRSDRGYTREDQEAIGGPYTDYGHAFGGYGAGGGYTPTPEEGVGRERRSWDERSAPGAWFGRAPEESWRDARPRGFEGPHRGRGPKGYTRSGERIREDVSDRLADDTHLDASDIEVEVTGTEVTLNGTVESRAAKRRAEDHADDVTGVTHVQNNLRVRPRPGTVAAQTDPRIAAVTEGRDADEAARDLAEARDDRLGRLQR